MTGAGHNNPPAFEAHSLHIEDLFALVNGTTASAVEDDETEQVLDGLLDDLRQAKKDADTERATEKKPHDDAAKAVQAKWKPLLDRCDMAALQIKRLLTPYREGKQRARDEEARQAREAAEQQQREAQEALRSSDDMEERFEAEQKLKGAKKLTAVANKLDRTSIGLRTRWTHRIVSRGELLKHVKERYPEDLADMLNELVRQKVAAGVREMPGVEITPEKQAA
jgi:hypothetical protein